MSTDNTVADVMQIKIKHGFTGIPVTDNGKLGGKLVGLVTLRDIDFLPKNNWDIKVSEVNDGES